MSKIKTLTTSKLIHSIKLRAAIPESQNSFKEEDFLYFINEEIDLGVVPHIQTYHEDYFLFSEYLDIVPNQSRYTIPDRAVGVKLRDVCYEEGNNLYEFTRISVEDLADGFNTFEQSSMKAFYIEGDEIVIPSGLQNGRLKVSYYIRPNTIVSEEDVAVVTNINLNSGIVTVDKYPDKFVDISSFDITSCKSSFRLVAKEITPDGLPTSDNFTFTFGTIKKQSFTIPSFGTIISGDYIQIIDNSNGLNDTNVFFFDTTGITTPPSVTGANIFRVDISTALNNTDILTIFSSVFNSTFVNDRLICQVISSNSFSIENGGAGISVGNNFTVSSTFTLPQVTLSEGTVTIPKKLNKGDVIALPEETTIPQIPIELHSMLAQRVAMRCLESLGDVTGLQAAAAKLTDMEIKTGPLLNDRVESAPLKINPRHTPIKRAVQKNYRRR